MNSISYLQVFNTFPLQCFYTGVEYGFSNMVLQKKDKNFRGLDRTDGLEKPSYGHFIT